MENAQRHTHRDMAERTISVFPLFCIMVIEEGDRRSSVAGYRAVLPRSGEEPVGDDAAHM